MQGGASRTLPGPCSLQEPPASSRPSSRGPVQAAHVVVRAGLSGRDPVPLTTLPPPWEGKLLGGVPWTGQGGGLTPSSRPVSVGQGGHVCCGRERTGCACFPRAQMQIQAFAGRQENLLLWTAEGKCPLVGGQEGTETPIISPKPALPRRGPIFASVSSSQLRRLRLGGWVTFLSG